MLVPHGSESETKQFASWFLIHRFPTSSISSGVKRWLLSKNGATIEQLHVGIAFYPIGSTGLIGCHVQRVPNLCIAMTARNNNQWSPLSFETSYEQLRLFGQELLALAHGECQEATLGKKRMHSEMLPTALLRSPA